MDTMIYPLATTMAMEDPAFVHNFLACFLFESLIVPSFPCFAGKTRSRHGSHLQEIILSSAAKIRKVYPSFTNSTPLTNKKGGKFSIYRWHGCSCFGIFQPIGYLFLILCYQKNHLLYLVFWPKNDLKNSVSFCSQMFVMNFLSLQTP